MISRNIYNLKCGRHRCSNFWPTRRSTYT